MPSNRSIDPVFVGWQTREFNPFTEVLEVVVKAGKDIAKLPQDQDFKSDATKIIGMRLYVNNADGTAKSPISQTKLLPQRYVASGMIEMFENNSEKVYRMPLEKMVGHNTPDTYTKIFLQGYSSAMSHIKFGEMMPEDVAILVEFIYV